MMASPKLIVFDLDYTLWPFWVTIYWVDTHVSSPFKKENNNVIDSSGEKIRYYPEVLEKLKQKGYILGVASRTEWPEGARNLLKLFDWNKYFTYTEIYPGRKRTHFQRMHEESGIPYSEMLFFDDEQRNISDLKAIGVKSILIDHGVNLKIVEDALKSFETF